MLCNKGVVFRWPTKLSTKVESGGEALRGFICRSKEGFAIGWLRRGKYSLMIYRSLSGYIRPSVKRQSVLDSSPT